MARNPEPVIRDAVAPDVAAICRFGEAHIQSHYAPLIGDGPADQQVRRWWNETYIAAGVAAGQVVVAEDGGELVGVAQRGRNGADHVIYKLYVHPDHRGRGIGPLLIAGLVRQLPPGTERVFIEQFAGNARAGAFYEREGFTVDRIEPGPTDALAVVWRVQELGPEALGHRDPALVDEPPPGRSPANEPHRGSEDSRHGGERGDAEPALE